MIKHARIAPSSLYRLFACPGSLKLSDTMTEPGETSSYAAEGTVAHSLLEEALVAGWERVDALLGTVITEDGHDITVTTEMLAAVCKAYDHVEPYKKSGLHLCEARVQIDGAFAGTDRDEDKIFGTADFVHYEPGTRTLTVADYKHGKGVPVEVEDNPQLRTYALGAAMSLGKKLGFTGTGGPLNVDITILQPRAPHRDGPVRTENLSMMDLMIWADTVLKPGIDAMLADDPALATGSHCRFCPCRSFCPALRQLATDTAKVEFGEIPPDPNTLSDTELGLILDQAEVIASWVSAVRAEASSRLDHGHDVPNWKLVPKRATRKWEDDALVEKKLRELGMHDTEIYKRELYSPAQIEKELSVDQFSELDDLIVAKSSGSTLVPDTDPREKILSGPKEDFTILVLTAQNKRV